MGTGHGAVVACRTTSLVRGSAPKTPGFAWHGAPPVCHNGKGAGNTARPGSTYCRWSWRILQGSHPCVAPYASATRCKYSRMSRHCNTKGQLISPAPRKTGIRQCRN